MRNLHRNWGRVAGGLLTEPRIPKQGDLERKGVELRRLSAEREGFHPAGHLPECSTFRRVWFAHNGDRETIRQFAITNSLSRQCETDGPDLIGIRAGDSSRVGGCVGPIRSMD